MAQLLLGSPLPHSAQKAYFEGRDGPWVADRERGSRGWGQGAWALEQEGLCALLYSSVVCRCSQAAPDHAPHSAREVDPSAWTQARGSLSDPRAHFGSPAPPFGPNNNNNNNIYYSN